MLENFVSLRGNMSDFALIADPKVLAIAINESGEALGDVKAVGGIAYGDSYWAYHNKTEWAIYGAVDAMRTQRCN